MIHDVTIRPSFTHSKILCLTLKIFRQSDRIAKTSTGLVILGNPFP